MQLKSAMRDNTAHDIADNATHFRIPRNSYEIPMASTSAQMRNYQGPVFFSFGFRPFFLGGTLVAAITPIITALTVAGYLPFNHPLGVVSWHAHEMLYGFLAAVVAGFSLTAVPNWTGRVPVLGWRLMVLFGLWAMGRAVMFAAPGAVFAGIIDAAYLVLIDAVLWREVIAGKNWRNTPVCFLVGLFASGNIVWHASIIDGGTGDLGLRLGLAAIAILLGLIGGRVTPSFTRNWFVKTKRSAPDVAIRTIDKITIGILIAAIGAWVLDISHWSAGATLILASMLTLIRLSRWQGWRTLAEPLVTILHIGYLWLAVALFLLGFSALYPALVAPSTAVHALTAGAAGVLPLAVMTRATLGHTGRPLTADYMTTMIYVLVNFGAIVRLAAPYFAEKYMALIMAAGISWSAAFGLFAVIYGPYLIAPRLPANNGN